MQVTTPTSPLIRKVLHQWKSIPAQQREKLLLVKVQNPSAKQEKDLREKGIDCSVAHNELVTLHPDGDYAHALQIEQVLTRYNHDTRAFYIFGTTPSDLHVMDMTRLLEDDFHPANHLVYGKYFLNYDNALDMARRVNPNGFVFF